MAYKSENIEISLNTLPKYFRAIMFQHILGLTKYFSFYIVIPINFCTRLFDNLKMKFQVFILFSRNYTIIFFL